MSTLPSKKNLKLHNDIVMSSSTNLKGHAVHFLMGKTNLVVQNPNLVQGTRCKFLMMNSNL